jgi:hypothetical protein
MIIMRSTTNEWRDQNATFSDDRSGRSCLGVYF